MRIRSSTVNLILSFRVIELNLTYKFNLCYCVSTNVLRKGYSINFKLIQ